MSDTHAVLVLHGGSAHEAAVDDGLYRLVPLQQGGAGGCGVVGHELVEVAAPNDVAVLGVHRVRRPLQFELSTGARGPKPVVAVEFLQGVAEAHQLELVHRSGGEAVAAGLFAREGLLLDDRHRVAVTCQPISGRGSGRAAADHQHVGGRCCAARHGRQVWPLPGRSGHTNGAKPVVIRLRRVNRPPARRR